MTIYQPETHNQEFWNRIDQMPLDTVKSRQEFWQLIHEPGADSDSGRLEYQHRFNQLNLSMTGDNHATI